MTDVPPKPGTTTDDPKPRTTPDDPPTRGLTFVPEEGKKKETSPPKASELSIVFAGASLLIVQKLAADLSSTPERVLGNAIATYNYLWNREIQGDKVLIEGRDGKFVKVRLP